MSRKTVINKVIKNMIETYVTEVVVITSELLRNVGLKIELTADQSTTTSKC